MIANIFNNNWKQEENEKENNENIINKEKKLHEKDSSFENKNFFTSKEIFIKNNSLPKNLNDQYKSKMFIHNKDGAMHTPVLLMKNKINFARINAAGRVKRFFNLLKD